MADEKQEEEPRGLAAWKTHKFQFSRGSASSDELYGAKRRALYWFSRVSTLPSRGKISYFPGERISTSGGWRTKGGSNAGVSIFFEMLWTRTLGSWKYLNVKYRVNKPVENITIEVRANVIKYVYRVFRNLWDPLPELIVRLKIMKKNHINICPVCLRLWDIMNFINRANSGKLVLHQRWYIQFS